MHQIISSSTMRMTSREIAELVGSRHDSVKRAIERLATPKDDGTPAVIQLPPMVEVENNQSLSQNSRSKAYLFQGEKGKRDSIVVVAQLSPEFTARLVDRWQELESKEASRQPVPQLASPIESDLRAIAIIGQSMRMSDSGVLMMYHSYCKANAPKVAAVLPPYAIDAPTGKESEGSKSHAAIKDICQGIMSAVKANKALLKAGLLEQLERPSTSAPNGIKTYKSVTAKGLKYGLNVTSQKNVRETQPHWYLETADELIEIIKANGV